MYSQNLVMDSFPSHYQTKNSSESTTSYYNYSESSDCLSNQSSPTHSSNFYEYQNCNTFGNVYGHFGEDIEMEEERVDDSANFTTAPVNRGGRKQVKVGTTKRNARERNRVRYINSCFEVLREHIPFDIVDEVRDDKNKKLSKVETLKYAAIYIQKLSELLESADSDASNCHEVKTQKVKKIKQDVQLSEVKKCGSKKAKTSSRSNAVVNSQSSSVLYNNINVNVCENRGAESSSPVYSSTSPCSTASSADYRYFPQELSPNVQMSFHECSRASLFQTTGNYINNYENGYAGYQRQPIGFNHW